MQPRRYELSDFEWSIIAPLLPKCPFEKSLSRRNQLW